MSLQPETLPPPPPKSNRRTWTIVGIVAAVLVVCLCIVTVIVGLVLGIPYLEKQGLLGTSAVGTWNVSYDWGCTGSTQSDHFYIYSDGSYSDDSSSGGNWTLSGGQITLTYGSGTVYTGSISGSQMNGTMVSYDQNTGCWTSTRAAP